MRKTEEEEGKAGGKWEGEEGEKKRRKEGVLGVLKKLLFITFFLFNDFFFFFLVMEIACLKRSSEQFFYFLSLFRGLESTFQGKIPYHLNLFPSSRSPHFPCPSFLPSHTATQVQ